MNGCGKEKQVKKIKTVNCFSCNFSGMKCKLIYYLLEVEMLIYIGITAKKVMFEKVLFLAIFCLQNKILFEKVKDVI